MVMDLCSIAVLIRCRLRTTRCYMAWPTSCWFNLSKSSCTSGGVVLNHSPRVQGASVSIKTCATVAKAPHGAI